MVALIGGAIAATGAIAGSAISASGAESAASTAANAAKSAAQLQLQQQQQTRADLLPYDLTGQGALGQLQPLYDTTTNNLNSAYNAAGAAIPTNFTQAQLLQNPGYQFQVQQGQKALTNSLGSRGLSGLSGTQTKAALNFGTGLAQSNWQQLYNNAQTTYGDLQNQYSNRLAQGNSLFSQLSTRAQIGENAGALTGVQGTLAAGNAGSNIAGAGQASAQGTLQAGNAIANGVAGVGYQASNYLNSPAGKAALTGTDTSGAGGTTSAYTNPVDGQSYQSSSNPDANF